MESLVNVLKLLSLSKLCTFSEYSLEFIITIVLPLSALITIAFSVANFFFISFTTCSYLMCNVFFFFGGGGAI